LGLVPNCVTCLYPSWEPRGFENARIHTDILVDNSDENLHVARYTFYASNVYMKRLNVLQCVPKILKSQAKFPQKIANFPQYGAHSTIIWCGVHDTLVHDERFPADLQVSISLGSNHAFDKTRAHTYAQEHMRIPLYSASRTRIYCDLVACNARDAHACFVYISSAAHTPACMTYLRTPLSARVCSRYIPYVFALTL
jgi:hypothetical protein